MAKTNIGINGFGRIGRQILRIIHENYADTLQVTAINGRTAPQQLAHLFKYDSTYGRYSGEVDAGDGELIVDGESVVTYSEPNPGEIPWSDAGVQIVLECTGAFTKREQAIGHLGGSVEKVVISAPASDEDITIVLGVNDDEYDADRHHVISNASCTTNCVAPMVKVLHDHFGVEHALMSTIHAYTNDQNLLDKSHKDPRRARSAANNIIPTTTGAAKAVAVAIPELKGRIDGVAFRVPVISGSVTDLTAQLSNAATVEAINDTFRAVAEGAMNGILKVSDEPLVSSDYVGDPHSCTIDALSTAVLSDDGSDAGSFVKIVGWYDNEWGYSRRTVDLTRIVAESLR